MQSTQTTPHVIDAGRLRRAISRTARRIGPDVYMVEGKHEPWYRVDLGAEMPCTCMDARTRSVPCLHELSARLHAGDGALIAMLNELFAATERELRTARVRARKAGVAA